MVTNSATPISSEMSSAISDLVPYWSNYDRHSPQSARDHLLIGLLGGYNSYSDEQIDFLLDFAAQPSAPPQSSLDSTKEPIQTIQFLKGDFEVPANWGSL